MGTNWYLRGFRREALRREGFDAFISYSHAADGRLAPALQLGLGALAKPWYRRRALRVFRDQSSLSASPQLWPAIEEALSRSRYFVLLASTEAARSHWIEQEVRWWRANRSHDTLLIALTEGDLRWDEAGGDFAPGTAVPSALRGWFPAEPLWVDLRWARKERDLSMRNPHFRAAVADLAAPLRGLPKDELIGEDIDQHRRTLRLVRASVAVLVVLLVAALVGGVVALVQRNRAEEERNLAFARELAAQSVAQRATDPELALLLGMEAVRRSAVPETEAALREALAGNRLRAAIPVSERPLSSVEYAPDGATILTAGFDGRARLIDTAAQAPTETLRAGPRGLTDAAFARHGSLILTTNAHQGSRLWSAAGGRLIRQLPDRAEHVRGGAISPDGDLIATIVDGGVHLWTGAGRSRGIWPFRHSIDSVAFSPDGRLLAVGDWLGVVRIRRLATGTTSPKMRAGLIGIADIAFGPSGRSVLAGGENGEVQLWDIPSGESSRLFERSSETPYPQEAGAFGISSTGRFALGNRDGTLIVKDLVPPGRTFRTQTGGGGVAALDFAPDGRSLVTAHEDGSIRLFAAAETSEDGAAVGPETIAYSLASGRDGRLVAETFWPSPNVDSRDVPWPIGTWVWRLPDRKVWKVSEDGADLRAAFSPDGRTLAIAGKRGTRVWPLFARRPSVRFPAAGADVSFSPDGTLLAVAERERGVKVRRVDDGRLVEALPDDGRHWAYRIAFSPDGSRLLAVGTDGVIRLWDRGEQRVVRRIGSRRTRFAEAVFSPDGDAIAAISDARLAIADLQSGETAWTAPLGSNSLNSVAFSPDGRNVVVAGKDGRATVLAAEGLLPITTFAIAGASMNAAKFNGSSTSLVIAGDWGLKVYRCRLCASASGLLADAEETAIRDLSAAERRRFLHRSG